MGSSMTRKVAWIALLLSLGLPQASCTPRMLTVAEEKQLGERDPQGVRQENTLLRDRVVVTYIRKLGAELAKASPPSPYDLRFYVIESDDLNAMAIAGGAIYINTGTILKANNVAELAGVLAHEIGHVTERHIVRIYMQSQKAGFFAGFIDFIVGLFARSRAVRNTGDLALGLGLRTYLTTFSREFEREADKVGLETLIRADYDPEGLPAFFETIIKENPKGGLPQFLQTHPAPPERIEQARALIAASPKLGDRRTQDDKLAAIKRRIQLIQGMGNDSDDEADDEADDESDGEGGAKPAPTKKSTEKPKP
jgi:beta-barrel assembly-enhancing protease